MPLLLQVKLRVQWEVRGTKSKIILPSTSQMPLQHNKSCCCPSLVFIVNLHQSTLQTKLLLSTLGKDASFTVCLTA